MYIKCFHLTIDNFNIHTKQYHCSIRNTITIFQRIISLLHRHCDPNWCTRLKLSERCPLCKACFCLLSHLSVWLGEKIQKFKKKDFYVCASQEPSSPSLPPAHFKNHHLSLLPLPVPERAERSVSGSQRSGSRSGPLAGFQGLTSGEKSGSCKPKRGVLSRKHQQRWEGTKFQNEPSERVGGVSIILILRLKVQGECWMKGQDVWAEEGSHWN